MAQMENQLVVVNIYKPVFNNETLKYEDRNPFIPNTKSSMRYKCLCKHSDEIHHTHSGFKKHLEQVGHCKYIRNYEENIKEVSDAHELIKQLKIQMLLERQTSLMKMKSLEDEVNKLKIKNRWLKIKSSSNIELDLD